MLKRLLRVPRALRCARCVALAVGGVRAQKWPPLLHAIVGGQMAVFDYLVASGADTASKDLGGWTMLHFTARHGCLHAAKCLLATSNQHMAVRTLPPCCPWAAAAAAPASRAGLHTHRGAPHASVPQKSQSDGALLCNVGRPRCLGHQRRDDSPAPRRPPRQAPLGGPGGHAVAWLLLAKPCMRTHRLTATMARPMTEGGVVAVVAVAAVVCVRGRGGGDARPLFFSAWPHFETPRGSQSKRGKINVLWCRGNVMAL